MFKTIFSALIYLLMFVGPVRADELADAMAAYDRQDYAAALAGLTQAAERGNAKAQVNLGAMYQRGDAVSQDYGQALKYYQLAANQGDAKAQANLGMMYQQGQGVAPDYIQAVKYNQLAADQGVVDAQVNLAVLYGRGRGIAQDYVQAYKWFSLAATSGDAGAAKGMELMASLMTPDQIAQAQKLADDWRPKK